MVVPDDAEVVGYLEGVLDREVRIAAADPGELRARVDLSGIVEGDTRKALHREREQRDIVLIGEADARLSDAVNARVVARVTGARFVDQCGAEEVGVADDNA